MKQWDTRQRARAERIEAGSRHAEGKLVSPANLTALLEAVIRPGDRVCLEGGNQKQADLLAEDRGHRTVGLLYGGSAAGAFIATALSCGTLVCCRGRSLR